MSDTPKKQKRRATILVTGPQSKKTIFEGESIKEEDEPGQRNQLTLQDLTLARQRLHNELAVVNTASGIQILMQIVMDELEVFRHRLRESGLRMRMFFSNGTNQIRAILFRIFSRSISSRNMIEHKHEAKVIMNEICDQTNTYKMPRYTLNEIEEVLLTDDLEDGIIQRRSEKWKYLPERQKPLYEEEEDAFCEFRSMNVPMSMTFEDDEMDRLSMPSTRTGVTALTTEDQMAAIQNQLTMLSKQLMSLQKGGVEVNRGSSRASSRRGAKRVEKKASIEISSNSSSSDISEDEGKGPSVCSPSLSLNRKVSESSSSKHSSTVSVQIAPMSLAPPPPPPPPPPKMAHKAPLTEIKSENLKTPPRATKKTTANSLPPAETIVSNRPYLTDIANGRSLLKKTVRSPGGSPACQVRHQKRAVSSFEAALRDRFRGFHGDNSFSEQEENGDDDDVNATWDE